MWPAKHMVMGVAWNIINYHYSIELFTLGARCVVPVRLKYPKRPGTLEVSQISEAANDKCATGF